MPALQNHKIFRSPADENAVIWRYMDFSKFVALLHNSSLFFAKSSSFEDHWEAAAPPGSWAKIPIIGALIDPSTGQGIAGPKARKLSREYIYLNCWHMNDSESAAMWKLYASSSDAVAICSTFAKLKNVLPGQTTGVSTRSTAEVYIGTIRYVDYKSLTFDGHRLEPYFHKRKAFEHEQEVRCVIVDSVPAGPFETKLVNPHPGMAIDVKLDELLDCIVLSPGAPSWFEEIVRGVVGRYQVLCPVQRSQLEEQSPSF